MGSLCKSVMGDDEMDGEWGGVQSVNKRVFGSEWEQMLLSPSPVIAGNLISSCDTALITRSLLLTSHLLQRKYHQIEGDFIHAKLLLFLK